MQEALVRGQFDRCEGLSPDLRLRALRRAETIAPGLPVDESGPAMEAVRARVERLRELAAETAARKRASAKQEAFAD